VINIPKDEVIHRNLIKHLEDGLTL
jgi:hypothetical protein